MPGLGAHRVRKKQEYVQGVLNAQAHLRTKGAANIDEGIAAVSTIMSAPSKRFARALGVFDGTLALLEYASASAAEEANDVVKQEALCGGLDQIAVS